MDKQNEVIYCGDIVKHFKREMLNSNELKTNKYLYVVKGMASHTDSGEVLVIYQALYEPFQIYARPIEDFCSKFDKSKYPDFEINQEYRFEKNDIQPKYEI